MYEANESVLDLDSAVYKHYHSEVCIHDRYFGKFFHLHVTKYRIEISQRTKISTNTNLTQKGGAKRIGHCLDIQNRYTDREFQSYQKFT